MPTESARPSEGSTSQVSAATCSDEHSRFCSPCDTAKRYGSLHCGACGVPVSPRATVSTSAATVEHVAEFRNPEIPEHYPMREGWRVVCPVHGALDDGYAYAREQDAKAKATRHNRKVHR